MKCFATVNDLTLMWRTMSANEQSRASELIKAVSSELRTYAKAVGKDLDALVAKDEDLALVAKTVTVDTVARVLNQSTTDEALSQMSQTAGGYTVSGTYLVPGGGSLVLNRDLKRLGLRRQRYGVMDVWL